VPWLCNRHFFGVSYDIGVDQMMANLPISDRRVDAELWADFDVYIDDIMKKVRRAATPTSPLWGPRSKAFTGGGTPPPPRPLPASAGALTTLSRGQVLLFNGQLDKRVMIKGHFLAAAEGLERRCVLRARLGSCSSLFCGRSGQNRGPDAPKGQAAAALLRQKRAESWVVGGRPPEPPLRSARSHPHIGRTRTCARPHPRRVL
jgi:hypothetical protein